MRVVILHGSNGSPVAVNADEWHTIMKREGSMRSGNTQIGFSGPGSALTVQEQWEDFVQKLSPRLTS
jgi:hypothetical protein